MRGARWGLLETALWALAGLSQEEKSGPGLPSQVVGYPLCVFISFVAFRLRHRTGQPWSPGPVTSASCVGLGMHAIGVKVGSERAGSASNPVNTLGVLTEHLL